MIEYRDIQHSAREQFAFFLLSQVRESVIFHFLPKLLIVVNQSIIYIGLIVNCIYATNQEGEQEIAGQWTVKAGTGKTSGHFSRRGNA